ncbi:MAG: spermidine synthase [Gemmatimonadota bacterium]
MFFVSGASALIFETLWFHQASLAFGSSVWALSLVLSGFMGGLALGSATAVRKGDRLGPPVRTYAVLEVVIAVAGVALVYLLPSLGPLTTPLLRPVLDHPWILNPARLLLAFGFLLIPSTAMGLTLPLLTEALVAADPNFGRALGRLYGWNTLGAVLGAVVAETHLIGALGIHGTGLAAGSLNLLAALSASFIYRSLSAAGSSVAAEGATRFQLRGDAWLGAAFLSGFALLALEVVWFRFLLLFVIGTTLSFAVMLAVVLAGIALGGLAASFWLRRDQEAFRYAVIVSLASGLVCAVGYAAFPWVVAPFGSKEISGFFPVLRVSVPLILPASFLSGIFFTLAGAALRREYPSATATTGLLTFANTTGAALGALAGGFLLLPTLGMEASFFLMAVLYGAIGLVVMTRCRAPRLVLYPIGGGLVLALALFPWGAMQRRYLMTTAGRWAGAGEWRLVGLREGLDETILYVEELVFGGAHQGYRLVTNSLSMSTTEFHSRRYMKLYVYLPAALHPNPRSALLISYGVGSTAKALTETSSFQAIDVVDISRDVLEMNAIVFPDSAENPLHDPRVRVHIEDGRYFLQTTDRKFDLITGEPPPPQVATVVNLYTREYFQRMYDRLNEGGFVTYWLPLHSLSDGSARAVIKAFLEVFPDASLWHGRREDVMLVGTRNAQGPVSAEWFERQWHEPRLAEEMKAVGVERPEQLGALFIGDADYLRELTRNDAPLVDNFPKRILSDSALGQGSSTLFLALLDEQQARARFSASPLVRRLWPAPLIERSVPFFAQQRLINNLIGLSGAPVAKSPQELHFLVTQTTLTAPILWHLGTTSDVLRAIGTLSPEERALPIWQYQRAAGLFSERRFAEALEPLSKAEQSRPLFSTARVFRIYALCLLQRVDEARRLAAETRQAVGSDAPYDGWWEFLAQTYGVDVR